MTTGSVDAVLFDLDDTLCEYRRSGAELLSIAFERSGVEPFFELADYHERYEEFVDDSDGMAALRRECFAAIATDRGRAADLGHEIADVYAEERDGSDVRFLPGAREALDALAENHRLGLVTNGAPSMQEAKLEALGLAEEFETIVYAGYDAPAKPDPEPFHRALSALSTAPERAVYVGNSLTTDVPGAQAAGVDVVWLAPDPDANATPEPEPDHVVESLAELRESPWFS